MNYSDDYDGLIFDCDGTITDSMPLHYWAWQKTLSQYGINFPESRFYAMGGVPTAKIVEVLSAEQGISVDPVAVSQEKEVEFEFRIKDLRPRENVCEIIRQYSGKLPMAVASGSLRPTVDKQLKHVNVDKMFRVVVTAEDVELHKPEPDVFLKAAAGLGVQPTRCLVFEDAPMGVEAAKRAGMDCIDVTVWETIRTDNPLA